MQPNKKIFIAKIIFAICLCVSIVLLAYGSTRNVEDNSAFIYMGIGVAFVVILIGIAIYVYIMESKQNRK